MKDEIIKAIQKATGIKTIHLEVPEIEEHGDYSSNVAMQMFAKLKTQNAKLKTKTIKLKTDKKEHQTQFTKHNSPRELAKEIVGKLSKDKELAKIIEKMEVAGAGFINFWLKETVLVNQVNQVNQERDRYGSSDLGKGKKAIVEYSSPNIAKQFSVGHLRSTIIGQAIYNLLSFVGYKTVGDNHLGDWGTQFGMIIAQVIRKEINPKKLTLDDYEKLYVEFNKEAEKNPQLKEEGKKWFKKLEDGDKKARSIWNIAVKNSMEEFNKIYGILGVKIENSFGESFYEDKMQEVVKLLRNKKISKKSQGAEIVELDGLVPAILLKGDGGTTYYTRDLATVKFRIDKWDPVKILYEVGAEQILHFKQVFATAKLLGWVKGRKLIHIAHGLFLYEGKKMSTRKGTTIKLEHIIKEAIKRARNIVEESETGKDLSEREKESISKAVGVGAVKYFDLSHHFSSNINFDWEQTMALQGNSGPYLQYTVARTNSVLAKRKTQNAKLKTTTKNLKLNKEEKLLLRSFLHFPEVVEEAAEKYAPNLLCNYLHDLAQKYNGFYARHRILSSSNERSESKALRDNKYRIIDPEVKGKPSSRAQVEGKQEVKELRLGITQATGQILKNGLGLLGIQAPERM